VLRTSVWHDVRDGFRFVWGRRGLLWVLILLGVVNPVFLSALLLRSSCASVTREEKLQTTAPCAPAWDQCHVLGAQVYWAPGWSGTSCYKVQYARRDSGG